MESNMTEADDKKAAQHTAAGMRAKEGPGSKGAEPKMGPPLSPNGPNEVGENGGAVIPPMTPKGPGPVQPGLVGGNAGGTSAGAERDEANKKSAEAEKKQADEDNKAIEEANEERQEKEVKAQEDEKKRREDWEKEAVKPPKGA
jgi:hypothetical protein